MPSSRGCPDTAGRQPNSTAANTISLQRFIADLLFTLSPP